MRAPTVSVVIPTHDRAHLLPETLASVLGQEGVELEVVVVDDGSTDGTAEAVAAIAARDPRLIYLPLPRSGNLARVRNAGVARARGEVIAFLDSDDLLEEGALAAYLAALDAHPEAGWTLAGYRSFDSGGFRRTNLHPLPPPDGTGEAEPGSETVAALFFPVLRTWTTLYTSTIAVRRTVLDAVGPFEESLTTGEYDLFTRLAFEARAVVLHQPLVRIRKHPGNSSPGYGVEGFEDAIHGLERFYARGEVPRELYLERLLLYRSRLGRFLLGHGERRAARRQFLACLRLESWFRPFGLSLRLRTDSPAVLAVAEGAFRGFGPGEPGSSPDLDFLFLTRDVPDRERAATYQDSGDRVRVREGGSTLLVDRLQGRARGRFAPALLADPTRLRLEFLELAFQLLLPSRGFFGVHGAAVVHNGRAALLRAAGGGGKTTLAYAAARSGFQVLAEDAVWIDPSRESWWGLPWWFHPRPDAGRLFPELQGLPPALVRSGSPKLAVEMAALHPESPVPRALPGPVVLLERLTGGQSRIAPLSLTQALPLWHAGRAGTEEDFPGYEERVEELLRGNAWKLSVGDDLTAALYLLAGAVAAGVLPL